MMGRILDLLFGIHILLLVFISSCKCEQTCSFPNYPVGGSYSPKQKKFQPGDEITYSCEKIYILMGNETSKCKLNGDWSNPTPFCDLKANLRNARKLPNRGVTIPDQEAIDGNQKTCFPLKTGEKQYVDLDKQKVVTAIRLFLGTGTVDVNIYADKTPCRNNYNKYIETNQWVLISCSRSGGLSSRVTIQDTSPSNKNSTICEIEVYVKEQDGCEKHLDKKITNGYFEVSRSKARLICEDGFRSNYSRLLCEENDWRGSGLQCEEILCDPKLNITKKPGNEWEFLGSVKKISAGTRRQLKCSTGYQKTGSSDIIVCQKDGTWTETTAICVEEEKPIIDTRTIIYISVGTVVLLIIIILLATTIYFVRKQRRRPVVVVYKSPTEGSVISGSEGDYASAYYDTIRDYENIAPVPPASSRPTAQMLTDGYFLPLDSKDTLRKQPTPADIAFGTLKQSTLYGC